MNKAAWTDEEKATLRGLWPNATSGTIADILGRSRSAVCGKAHRMGLEDKKDGRPIGIKNKKRAVCPNQDNGTKLANGSVSEQDCTVSLLATKHNNCRAILEGQRDERGLAIVCGKLVEEGQVFSFCSGHLQIFTNRGLRNEPNSTVDQQLHGHTAKVTSAAQCSS